MLIIIKLLLCLMYKTNFIRGMYVLGKKHNIYRSSPLYKFFFLVELGFELRALSSSPTMVWLRIFWLYNGTKAKHSKNCTSKFEFWSFPRIAICNIIFSSDAGQRQRAHFPISHVITRVNATYTTVHCAAETRCFTA
jgi:hypothetical protein